MSQTFEEFMAHIGVKGMKWGVRNNKKISATLKKSESHSDRKEIDALRKKPLRTLSNAELTRISQRMNLERNVHSLKNSDAQKTIKTGKNWLDLSVKTFGTLSAAYALSTTPLGSAIIKGVKSSIK